MTLPVPEDVTSQSLVDTISKNPWVKARGALIREYAIKETAIRAADEIEALVDAENKRIMDEGDTYPPIMTFLETWIRVTRETTIQETP
jgi:hypothetical protein